MRHAMDVTEVTREYLYARRCFVRRRRVTFPSTSLQILACIINIYGGILLKRCASLKHSSSLEKICLAASTSARTGTCVILGSGENGQTYLPPKIPTAATLGLVGCS